MIKKHLFIYRSCWLETMKIGEVAGTESESAKQCLFYSFSYRRKIWEISRRGTGSDKTRNEIFYWLDFALETINKKKSTNEIQKKNRKFFKYLQINIMPQIFQISTKSQHKNYVKCPDKMQFCGSSEQFMQPDSDSSKFNKIHNYRTFAGAFRRRFYEINRL